jgi:hypothetical protein
MAESDDDDVDSVFRDAEDTTRRNQCEHRTPTLRARDVVFSGQPVVPILGLLSFEDQDNAVGRSSGALAFPVFLTCRRTEKRKAHSIENDNVDPSEGMELWKREWRYVLDWNIDEDEDTIEKRAK